jgi:hypothetical protein
VLRFALMPDTQVSTGGGAEACQAEACPLSRTMSVCGSPPASLWATTSMAGSSGQLGVHVSASHAAGSHLARLDVDHVGECAPAAAPTPLLSAADRTEAASFEAAASRERSPGPICWPGSDAGRDSVRTSHELALQTGPSLAASTAHLGRSTSARVRASRNRSIQPGPSLAEGWLLDGALATGAPVAGFEEPVPGHPMTSVHDALQPAAATLDSGGECIPAGAQPAPAVLHAVQDAVSSCHDARRTDACAYTCVRTSICTGLPIRLRSVTP